MDVPTCGRNASQSQKLAHSSRIKLQGFIVQGAIMAPPKYADSQLIK